MKSLIAHKLNRWFMLAALVIIVNGLLSWQYLQTIQANNASVIESETMTNRLDRLLSLLKDAETGQRGFIITGSEQYLAPYQTAQTELPSLLAEIEAYSSQRPLFIERLPELKTLIIEQQQELITTIDLRRSQGFEAAQAIVLENQGKQHMDSIRQIIDQLLDRENIRALERAAQTKLNVQRAGLALAFATLVATGFVIGTMALTERDVRRRELAANELRNQREWFAVTLASIGDAVLTTDIDGKISFMNHIATTITGWPEQQALGQSIHTVAAIFDPITKQELAHPVNTALAERQIVTLSNSVVMRQGNGYVAIEDSAAPIYDREQQVIGAVMVFRDVSERYRDEFGQRLLRTLHNRLATTIDLAQVLETSTAVPTPSFSAACGLYLLLDADEEPLSSYSSAHEPLLNWQQHPVFATALANGQAQIIDQALPEPYQSAIIIPFRDQHQLSGAMVFLHDQHTFDQIDFELAEELSQRMVLAIEQAYLYRQAQHAVRLRDVFLSIASHELKNPLTTLLGQSQLSLRRLERLNLADERLQRSLQAIEAQASRMNKMVTALLDVSRIETGQLDIQRDQIDLAQLLHDLVNDLAITIDHHQLSYHCTSSQPIHVTGDPIRLEQVFVNLINNAMKYSPEQTEVLVSADRNAQQAIVQIRDHGIGIPPESLPNLFTRFYRASNAARSHVAGLGIGLFVVKEIVDLHGGSIEVNSQVGQGSLFTVYLPLYVANPQ